MAYRSGGYGPDPLPVEPCPPRAGFGPVSCRPGRNSLSVTAFRHLFARTLMHRMCHELPQRKFSLPRDSNGSRIERGLAC